MHFSLSLTAAALLGTAAALPGDYGHQWKPSGWGTGSVSASSSSFPTAPGTAVTSSKPHGSGSVPPPVTETEKVYTTTTVCPVTSTQWANNTSSVITTLITSTITVTSCPGGCHGSAPTPTTVSHPSTEIPIFTLSAPYGTGSYKPQPTGGNPGKPHGSGSVPQGSGSVPSPVTETEKVYTTTTVCPITTTQWAHNTSTILTTLTTSTITVTSCPGGCHGSVPTPTTTPLPVTGAETITTTYPVTVVSTITSFVPCSTPVSSNAQTTYYSTWLTATSWTTSYETVTTSCSTIYPTSAHFTAPDSIVPVSSPDVSTTSNTVVPVSAPDVFTTSNAKPTQTSVNPGGPEVPAKETVTSATTLPAVTVSGTPEGTCPPAETVYSTVVSYITVYGEGAGPATATPIKPGSTFTWSAPAGGAGNAKPTGGNASPTGGNAQPSGAAAPSGY